MADALCKDPDFRLGQMDIKQFPDGERYLRLNENVKEQNVVVIGGTINDHDTLEMYDVACGLVNYGAGRLSLVIPYFGYSTQERKVKDGDIVLAKNRAVLISSIPSARRNNSILLLDLHSPGITHYFEGPLHCHEMTTLPIMQKILWDVAKNDRTIVACTDAGRAKWVESLANDAGLEAAFVYKKRLSATKTAVTGVNADVKGAHVVIYDDMIRSGGSFIKAAEAYMQAGALKITGVTTHGVFHDTTIERIQKSGLFECLHVTNSHPLTLEAGKSFPKFVIVHDVVPLLENQLKSAP
jgi:ribose-phosphate pyrophosphokinase